MFVVFEGGEGCGKSTQVSLLASALRERGTVCRVTREPGGTPLAEAIRTLFKAVPAHGDEPTPLAELHLVMAARAQHVATSIQPALARGETVICDRFLDSSHVYQGARGGVRRAVIDDAARPVLAGLVPDLTVILDLPAEAARARVCARAPQAPGEADRLDASDALTFEILARGFRDLALGEVPYPCGTIPCRVLIDATGTPEDVAARVLAAVDAALAYGVTRGERAAKGVRRGNGTA